MKKIRRLSLALFIFSVLALSYPATHVFAQGGAHVSGAHLSGGQCDSNPACNPASGTCCGQCDPGPACNPNDPNAIPCCGLEGNNMTNGSQPHGGFEPPRHPGKTNELDPRLVEKMKKMSHELKECQSLTKELKSAAQPQARQAPARCQPDTAMQRQLDEANQTIDEICKQARQIELLAPRIHDARSQLSSLFNKGSMLWHNVVINQIDKVIDYNTAIVQSCATLGRDYHCEVHIGQIITSRGYNYTHGVSCWTCAEWVVTMGGNTNQCE